MSDVSNPGGANAHLKQKLLEALQGNPGASAPVREPHVMSGLSPEPVLDLPGDSHRLAADTSVYGMLLDPIAEEPPLPEDLQQSQMRLQSELLAVPDQAVGDDVKKVNKSDFDDTLSMRGVVSVARTEMQNTAADLSPSSQTSRFKLESVISSGGSMADLSGYKDLSKAPMSFGDDEVSSVPTFGGGDLGVERPAAPSLSMPQPFIAQEGLSQDVDTEFSGNVKTLIRLVNELPEGVTKQTGAQIIRLTMEAMGISMEDVLSEAQSAQSEMLDAVRANIKKIEEYKTVIRKLETDIKYYQGKANELSEIIDLFILSNTSGQKMPGADD